MKKPIMLTCGALVSLTMLFVDTATPVSFVHSTYAQEINTDNVTIDSIKQDLLENEPINAEQLRQVPDDLLMTYSHEAASNPLVTNEAEHIKAIYELIANYTPSLGLVIGEDYDAYNRVVDAITDQASFTADQLKAVESTELLDKYRETMSNNGDNVGETIIAIEPWIQSEIEAYEMREAEAQNSEEIVTEETEAENETNSSNDESLTDSAGDSELESEESNQVDDSTEQLEQLSREIIGQTPITMEQLSAIPNDTLKELLQVPLESEEDFRYIFNQLLLSSPEVFQSEIREIRSTLVEAHQLNPDSLNQLVTDEELLWSKWEVEEQMGEDYEQLALDLVDTYQVERDTDTTLKYSSDAIRSMLIQQTPMTPEQLNQITDEQLKATLPEQADELVISDAFNQLVSDVPEVFESEVQRFTDALTVQEPLLDSNSLKANVSAIDLLWTEYQVWHEDSQENIPRMAEVLIENYDVLPGELIDASDSSQSISDSQEQSDVDESSSDERIASEIVQDYAWRTKLIQETPIIQSQLDLFSDDELVDATDSLNESPTAVLLYDALVEQYPERFTSEINRIKEELKEYSIDLPSLENKITDDQLLWREYEIYLREGQEDLEVLSEDLINTYGSDIVDNSTQYNDVKEQLVSNTPMTEEQFGQFSNETIFDYVSRLSSDDVKGLFDQLAKDFPEVFEEEAIKLREQLVDQTNIDADSLGDVTDATLLWQAYHVMHQSEENITIHEVDSKLLLNQLVENDIVGVMESESESEKTDSEPTIKTDTRTGVEVNPGNEPKNSQNTELTPGANASFPELSSESSSIESQSSEPASEERNLPLTGERSPWFYIIAGGAILVVALLLLLSGRRRK
ncbi:LPXTG cell wall anchor domain-containing protein [Aerococcaceae bacterium DSM 111020]|nr:LPXTG cell wall anchor domain-containing protein [Aerococcaceae bacterium DSM 111020]